MELIQKLSQKQCYHILADILAKLELDEIEQLEVAITNTNLIILKFAEFFKQTDARYFNKSARNIVDPIIPVINDHRQPSPQGKDIIKSLLTPRLLKNPESTVFRKNILSSQEIAHFDESHLKIHSDPDLAISTLKVNYVNHLEIVTDFEFDLSGQGLNTCIKNANGLNLLEEQKFLFKSDKAGKVLNFEVRYFMKFAKIVGESKNSDFTMRLEAEAEFKNGNYLKIFAQKPAKIPQKIKNNHWGFFEVPGLALTLDLGKEKEDPKTLKITATYSDISTSNIKFNIDFAYVDLIVSPELYTENSYAMGKRIVNDEKSEKWQCVHSCSSGNSSFIDSDVSEYVSESEFMNDVYLTYDVDSDYY